MASHDPSFSTETLSSIDPAVGVEEAKVLCGRYEILRELGRGAMGVVWHARDRVSGTEVAIKHLAHFLECSPHAVESMRANYRLVQDLHHPNIVGIKTLEPCHGEASLLLVMEYAPGLTLEQIRLAQGGTLSPPDLLPLLHAVATALDFGHRRGVLHRDVKPSNLLRARDGTVKVLDYGIAAAARAIGPDLLPSSPLPCGGTLAYMAPEQWLGQAQDGRVDQYGLAATAWELLVGRPPFEGENPADIRRQCLSAPLTVPKDMDARIFAVLQKALAKEPSERFATCSDFAIAYAKALASMKKRKLALPSRWLLLPGAATALVLLALSRFTWTQAPTPVHAPAKPAVAVPFAGLKYHALVIGINDYQKGWESLASARGDAEAVADVLESRYGFSVTRLLDGEASRAGMMQALDRVASLESDDALLIYYAGHGLYDPLLDEGFWIPSNGRPAREGALARESWIWNSTITKIINTSRARHILLIADSCYSGSLFRGGDMETLHPREWQWYRLAFRKPSRYLITSGDLEAVQDSGGRHSVFARQVLHYLRTPDHPIFSASDLGQAIRGRVSELTGQHLRMGQLAVPAHGGGEFVFVAAEARERASPLLADGGEPVEDVGFTGTSRADRVRDVIDLQQSGATNAARHTASLLLGDSAADDPLRAILAAGVAPHRDHARMDRIVRLLDALGKADAVQTPGPDPRYARPRVLALVGPPPGGPPPHQAVASGLRREFTRHPHLVLVDRELLGDVLQELHLEKAGLADPRLARLIGRLLPASVLVAWDFIEDGRKTEIDLRVVETASSRLLSSHGEILGGGLSLEASLQGIVSNVFRRIEETHPLEAGVLGVEPGGLLRVGFGRFHAVDAGMSLRLLSPFPETNGIFIAREARVLGQAEWMDVGENESVVRPIWTEGEAVPPPETWESLRVRATR